MGTKLIVTAVLTFVPLIDAALALPVSSTALVVAVVAIWMFVPSWGPWILPGVCLNLVRTRETHYRCTADDVNPRR